MAKQTECIDCNEEGLVTSRPAPHPGKRCATHHRAVKRTRSEGAWEKRIRETYDLSAEEYYEVLESQGGRCPLCERATGATKRLSIDHDHLDGRLRGVICARDNAILGHMRDDPAMARRFAEYLENPPAQKVLGDRVAPIWGTPAEKSKPRKKRYTRKRRSK